MGVRVPVSKSRIVESPSASMSRPAQSFMPMKRPAGTGCTPTLKCTGSTTRLPTAWMAPAPTKRSHSSHGCVARSSASTTTSAVNICWPMPAKWPGKRTIGAWRMARSMKRLLASRWRILSAGHGAGIGSGRTPRERSMAIGPGTTTYGVDRPHISPIRSTYHIDRLTMTFYLIAL